LKNNHNHTPKHAQSDIGVDIARFFE